MGVITRKNSDSANKRSVSALAKELSETVEESLENDYEDDVVFGDSHYDDYEHSNRADEESIEMEVNSKEFDIFTDFGDIHASKGDVPKYYIYKNGTLAVIKNHPYSWEKIQSELGAGQYKVRMTSIMTGKIIKTQSQAVSEPLVNAKDVESANQNGKFFELIQNMNTTLQEQQLRSEEKAREERERLERSMKEQQELLQRESMKQQDTMATLLTALMTKPKDDSTEKMMMAMQQQSQQNMQMMIAMMQDNKGKDNSTDMMQLIMQMNNNTMNMIKEMNQSTSNAFEKIGDKIASIQDKKPEGMSPLEMVTFFQNAQSQGFDQMKLLNELAEQKALEKAGSGSDDDSMTKTLIKSVAPVIGQLAQITANNKASEPMPSARPSHQQIPQQRANVSQGQAQNARERRPNQGGINANGQSGQRNTGLPRPKVVAKPAKTQVEVVQNSNSGKIEGSGNKEKALELLLPFIGECLMSAKSEADSARESIPVLTNAGLDPVLVIPQFSGNELISIANNMGLHDKDYNGLDNWLKGYYDEILSITTSQVRESTAN